MLSLISYNYNLPHFKVYKIPVKYDDFYATSKHILIRIDNVIKIFTHNKCRNIRLLRTINHNLILFIDKKCANDFLYRLILNNCKNIEDIILYLKVDDIKKIQEMTDGILVTYKNEEKIFYDRNLEIKQSLCLQPVEVLKTDTIIRLPNRTIQINNNEIIIDKKAIECRKIKKVVGCEEYLFVGNKETIKAVMFYK